MQPKEQAFWCYYLSFFNFFISSDFIIILEVNGKVTLDIISTIRSFRPFLF
jgi:hypothetical protein